MNARRVLLPAAVASLTLAGCRDAPDPARIGAPTFDVDDNPAQVLTIDHRVPHTSTVPANAGQQVELAVRERFVEHFIDQGDGKPIGKPVLFVHGASTPSPAVMDLRTGDYDWAGYLARSGFDVFMIDHQGSGLSTRPMMDDPCNTNPAQQSFLVPNPLSATCPVNYPFQLINSQSDWDELDAVVEYIRTYRGVEKVALIGYSQGSFRVGPYAIQHPDKVESVLFLAPIFNPNGRPSRAGTRFDAPVPLPVGSPAAQFGFPMRLTTKTQLDNEWSIELQCEGQRQDGIFEVVWSAIMENDPLGRTWGGTSPTATEGVMRVRNPFLWGWNNTTVQLDGTLGGSVPVLIIYGEHDRQVSATPFSVTTLYNAIPGSRKLSFEVACAGHFMPWEVQRRVLHHISKQWLKHGAVEDRTNGTFFVDTEGVIYPQ